MSKRRGRFRSLRGIGQFRNWNIFRICACGGILVTAAGQQAKAQGQYKDP